MRAKQDAYARLTWSISAFLVTFTLYITVSINSPQFAIQTKAVTKKILHLIPIHQWINPAHLSPLTVNWLSPTNGQSFNAGHSISPAISVTTPDSQLGRGLNVMIVMDTSKQTESKVTIEGVTNTRLHWIQNAALDILDNLPRETTSVGIIGFSHRAKTLVPPRPLTALRQKKLIAQAINDAYSLGGSNIGQAIELASIELSSKTELAQRPRQIILISDGFHDDNPTESFYWARFMGIKTHSVALKGLHGPGAINLFEFIPEQGGEFVWNNKLDDLLGSLKSTEPHTNTVKRLDIALANGQWLKNIALEKGGSFKLPPQTISVGENNYVAYAQSTDGSKITKTLTVVGKDPS